MPHSPTIHVTYATSGWKAKLTSAIHARNFIRIRIKGSTATQMKVKFEAFTVMKAPAPPLPFVPIPYPSIAASAVLVTLPELLSLILMALTAHGYSSMKVGFDPKGSGSSDNELLLDLA